MNLEELKDELNRLHEIMDSSIDLVTEASKKAQDEVYEAIVKLIEKFEISDGRYVVNQDLGRRIALLQRKIESILGDVYLPSIKEYLSTYRTIEETNISLQKSYNDLTVEVSLLTPARKTIYEQAKYYLSEGLADAYIQPAKYLVMQHVTTGISIKDSQRIIKNWNEGETVGNIKPTVNLQRYATQISRDATYQYHGAINEIIAKEYGLAAFIYTGDIIEDSRPICKHLVGLRRTIELDEMPALIKKYPEGLYPNTSKKNFIQVRGGYGCRHGAFAVRRD